MQPGRVGAERRARRVESEARAWPRTLAPLAAVVRQPAKGARDFQVNAGALSRDASLASALLSFAPVDHLRVRFDAAPAAPFMHFTHAHISLSSAVFFYYICIYFSTQ